MSYNWNTAIVHESVAAARFSIQDWLFVGDSKNGCQTNALFKGTRDIAFEAFMPSIGQCAGALYAQPWGGGALLGGHPWQYPFFTNSANAEGHRQMGVLTAQSSAFTTYSVHDTAPADDDGDTAATTYPGEVKSADCATTMEFMIPQGGGAWPSNGTGGVVQMGNNGNDANRRCTMVSFPSVSGFAYNSTNAPRFWRYWQYIPGTASGTRAGYSSFQVFARRRNIPAPGGANKYDTAQIQIQRQSFNGSLTGLSGTNASTPVSTGGNWTNEGSVIPTGTDYAFQIFTTTPASPVHGIGLLGTGADYNDAATARGFAIGGISAMFSGVTYGLRTGILTRGGFKADTLNDTVHDGSATDPQRVILEGTTPDLLWLTFGTNDAGVSVTANDYADELFDFMERVWTYLPNQKFVIVASYGGTGGGAYQELMEDYAEEVYERLSGTNETRVSQIDLYTPGVSTPSSYYNTTHLNTNDSGMPFFVNAMQQAVGGGRDTLFRYRQCFCALRRGMIWRS